MRSFARSRWRAGGNGRITSRSLDDAIPEVSHRRRLDHSGAFQVDHAPVEVAEEARSAAEEERGDVDLELVDQAGAEELLEDARTARNGDVLAACGRAGLLDRGSRPAGDENERRPALLDERLPRVVRDDEDRGVEGRVVTPPAVRA